MSTHSAEKRVPGKVGAWRWVVLVAGAVLAAVFVFSIVLAVVAAIQAAGKPNWMERTGPIGDTFGGLLGPILSTAALGATIAIAFAEGRRIDRERNEREDADKESHANGLVAWIAETPRNNPSDTSHLGVVVTNGTGSLVRDVDLVVKVTLSGSRGERRMRNREKVVPPGTWFLQLDRGVADEDAQPEDVNGGWPAPVPVDAGGQLRVWLPSVKGGDLTEYALRVHPPEVDDRGEVQPYFELDELRFALGGQRWRRETGDTLSRFREGSDQEWNERRWNLEFEEHAKVWRPLVKAPRQARPANPVTQERIRRIAAALVGKTPEAIVPDERYPLVPELRKTGLLKLRVSRLQQSIFFYNTEVDNDPHVLWLGGSGRTEEIPQFLQFDGAWKGSSRQKRLSELKDLLVPLSGEPEQLAQKFRKSIGEYLPDRPASSPAVLTPSIAPKGIDNVS